MASCATVENSFVLELYFSCLAVAMVALLAMAAFFFLQSASRWPLKWQKEQVTEESSLALLNLSFFLSCLSCFWCLSYLSCFWCFLLKKFDSLWVLEEEISLVASSSRLCAYSLILSTTVSQDRLVMDCEPLRASFQTFYEGGRWESRSTPLRFLSTKSGYFAAERSWV